MPSGSDLSVEGFGDGVGVEGSDQGRVEKMGAVAEGAVPEGEASASWRMKEIFLSPDLQLEISSFSFFMLSIVRADSCCFSTSKCFMISSMGVRSE